MSVQRRLGSAAAAPFGVWRLAGNTVPTPGSEVEALAPRARPGLQILLSIDDAAAEFRVARSRAVSAVLFESSAGKAQETRGLGRAQIAWRQIGHRGGHGRALAYRGAPPNIGGYRRSLWRRKSGKGDGEDWEANFATPRMREAAPQSRPTAICGGICDSRRA